MKKHKRKRVHGVRSPRKANALLTIGSIAVGYLAADTINDQVDKIVPKTKDSTGAEVPNGKIAMAGELGIGGLLLLKKFGGKLGMPLKIVGGVLVGAGLKRSLKELGVIKGYQNTPVIGGRRGLGGYQNTPVIGKSGVPPQLSGIPSQLSGYTPAGSGVGGYNSQGSGVMGSMNGSGITM